MFTFLKKTAVCLHFLFIFTEFVYIVCLQGRTPLSYYPPKNYPAIKFDHPVQINGLQYPQPISPAPGLQPNSYPTYPTSGAHNYPAGPPTAEDGFMPLFMPDKSDPVLTQRIEKLPAEGYTLPNYGPGQYPGAIG